MVLVTKAVVYISAMMVKFLNAFLAIVTVEGSVRLNQETVETEIL